MHCKIWNRLTERLILLAHLYNARMSQNIPLLNGKPINNQIEQNNGTKHVVQHIVSEFWNKKINA